MHTTFQLFNVRFPTYTRGNVITLATSCPRTFCSDFFDIALSLCLHDAVLLCEVTLQTPVAASASWSGSNPVPGMGSRRGYRTPLFSIDEDCRNYRIRSTTCRYSTMKAIVVLITPVTLPYTRRWGWRTQISLLPLALVPRAQPSVYSHPSH